jgi:hypothetical protein
MKRMMLYVAHLCKIDHVIVYYSSLMCYAGEVLSALRGDGKMVAGTNESLSSVQQRKEEARRKRRKKKRTGSSLVSSCFQGMVWGGGEMVAKFLHHLCVSIDELPVKPSEKMLSLSHEFRTEYKRSFVGAVLLYVPHRSKFVCLDNI